MDTHKTRKRRKTEMLYTPVDRTKLTLGDLIHMNPTSNPMTWVELGDHTYTWILLVTPWRE